MCSGEKLNAWTHLVGAVFAVAGSNGWVRSDERCVVLRLEPLLNEGTPAERGESRRRVGSPCC